MTPLDAHPLDARDAIAPPPRRNAHAFAPASIGNIGVGFDLHLVAPNFLGQRGKVGRCRNDTQLLGFRQAGQKQCAQQQKNESETKSISHSRPSLP